MKAEDNDFEPNKADVSFLLTFWAFFWRAEENLCKSCPAH